MRGSDIKINSEIKFSVKKKLSKLLRINKFIRDFDIHIAVNIYIYIDKISYLLNMKNYFIDLYTSCTNVNVADSWN